MKRFILGSIAALASLSSGLSMAQPDIVRPTYAQWCEGAAEKAEDGFITLGFRQGGSQVTVLLHKSKGDVRRDVKPLFTAEWNYTVERKQFITSILASDNLEDLTQATGMFGMFTVRERDGSLKSSGFLTLKLEAQDLTRKFPSLTCKTQN